MDNGTGFTARALDHWAYWNQAKLDFSRPGKPSDNLFNEASNGSLRRECPSQHQFVDLDAAQPTLQPWKNEYNNVRPVVCRTRPQPASEARGPSSRTRSGSAFHPGPGPDAGGGPIGTALAIVIPANEEGNPRSVACNDQSG